MDQDEQNQENLRAKYADTAEWARHYSTVRMTVATFVITVCVAIIALKPEKLADTPAMINAVCLLWLLGLLIFYAFTYFTYKSLREQSNTWIKLDTNNKPFGSGILSDLASWVMLVLNSVAVWLLLRHKVELPMWCGFKALMFLASVLGFVFTIGADWTIAHNKDYVIPIVCLLGLVGLVASAFICPSCWCNHQPGNTLTRTHELNKVAIGISAQKPDGNSLREFSAKFQNAFINLAFATTNGIIRTNIYDTMDVRRYTCLPPTMTRFSAPCLKKPMA